MRDINITPTFSLGLHYYICHHYHCHTILPFIIASRQCWHVICHIIYTCCCLLPPLNIFITTINTHWRWLSAITTPHIEVRLIAFHYATLLGKFGLLRHGEWPRPSSLCHWRRCRRQQAGTIIICSIRRRILKRAIRWHCYCQPCHWLHYWFTVVAITSLRHAINKRDINTTPRMVGKVIGTPGRHIISHAAIVACHCYAIVGYYCCCLEEPFYYYYCHGTLPHHYYYYYALHCLRWREDESAIFIIIIEAIWLKDVCHYASLLIG